MKKIIYFLLMHYKCLIIFIVDFSLAVCVASKLNCGHLPCLIVGLLIVGVLILAPSILLANDISNYIFNEGD